MRDVAITVHAAFDDEAGVWFVKESDLHGVNAEAPTLEAFVTKLQAVILDLLEDDDCAPERDVPLDVIAHSHSSVRVRRAV